MNRIMNTLQFKTTCLTFSLLFLTCIFSQTLYETNYQQYIILNRESKDVCLQSLLDEREALLKETTSNLQNCSDIKDAFNEKPCYGNIHNISIFFYFKNIAPPLFDFHCNWEGVQHIMTEIYWTPILFSISIESGVQTLLLLNIDYPQPLCFHSH